MEQKLKELVDLFEHNKNQYKGKHYDEANTRADFIDKFFKVLGWDIHNDKGYAEQYREVVREDKVEIKGKVKAPDYSFRVGGIRKFFVEAKKPSVDIKHDIGPAFQLRRYSYTAKLPLSILTDFEEFAVYDTRIKPDKNDKASTARIFYCTYEEYKKEAEFIFNTFSKDAILKGSFDKYIEGSKRKKGTSEVDKEFLKLIEKWREDLAKNIALRNRDLTIHELNYAVQKIIDRIIFLRIAEDRHTEKYGRIQKLLKSEIAIYTGLVSMFAQADAKYNSGIFDFKADQITKDLKIDDKVFKGIIRALYYPDSPYEFSVFDVEILGNIYEQFLGKTIRLTAGHQAKIEDKPEVKKAGGVYYTPKYIVDYIVKNTVGEKIRNKTPEQITELKIVDPACGSGSFLLGAYQVLMDYHLNYYTKEKNLKKSLKENKIYQLRDNEYRLTIEEKHKILLNNIFGVDIDSQAVEVSKLSLLLKLLEGESQESAGQLFKFSDIKLLPDLSFNIKCGNSLIGSDFYESGQMNLFEDEETARRINVFDWDKEFPEIFAKGGFDVVIGNPPYIRIQNMKEYASEEIDFFKTNYISATKGNYDIYVVFVEKGLSLLSQNGKLGFILPHKFFNSKYGEPIRDLISKGQHLSQIIHFGDTQVFQDATTYTCLQLLNKSITKKFMFSQVDDLIPWRNNIKPNVGIIQSCKVTNKEWNFVVGKNSELFEKMSDISPTLGDIAEIFVGLQTSADDVFIMDFIRENNESITLFSKSLNKEWTFEKPYLFPLLSGIDVKRYVPFPLRQYILFPYEITNNNFNLLDFKILESEYKKTSEYLKQNKTRLESREKGRLKSGNWYGYIYHKNMIKQGNKKICIPRLVKNLHAMLDIEGSYYLDNVDVGGITLESGNIDLKFLLGLFNSKLLQWYFPFVSAPFRGGYRSANKQFISQLPIKTINSTNNSECKQYKKIVDYVDQMFLVQTKYQKSNLETEKNILKKQINILDNQIDQLVYKLYGLTGAEIKIVEKQVER